MERDPPAWPRTSRPSGTAVAAGLGGAWGLAGYALLWGYTPIVVHRSFVVSAVGTVVLLPIRAVLAGIRLVEERVAGHPFEFSESNGWIGLLATAVGGAIALVLLAAARTVTRRGSNRSRGR